MGDGLYFLFNYYIYTCMLFDDRLSRVRFLAVYSPSILLMRLPSICSYLICYVRYIPIDI